MRNQDRMNLIAPDATMKLLVFGVSALVCLLFLIGLVEVGVPALNNILSNNAAFLVNPASSS